MLEMVIGYDPMKYFLLSMLELPFSAFPEYKGCYTGDQTRRDLDGKILVNMAIGGKYRILFAKEIKILQAHSDYIEDYDLDEERNAIFVFDIPSDWEDDFDKIVKYEKGIWEYVPTGVSGVSTNFKTVVYNMYPDDNTILKILFDD